MRGRLSPQLSSLMLDWPYVKYKVNSRQQEVRPVGLGDECVHRFQGIIRQLQILREHDDRDLWFDLLDLSRDDWTIQKAQVVLEHNCIHGPRHEKPQTIVTIARSYQFVSVFLQQSQLSRIAVYAE